MHPTLNLDPILDPDLLRVGMTSVGVVPEAVRSGGRASIGPMVV
jgi:hypothetical protein